jgi:prepilin-type N-terminal cleavage/methylation domain-containing protein
MKTFLFPGQRGRICGSASSRGFTLVEVLTAATIGALLLALLAAIATQTLKSTKKTNASMTSVSAAGAAVDMLTNDLDSLAVTQQPYEYLQTQQVTLSSTTLPSSKLLLVCISPTDYSSTEAGQAHAVCYQLYNQDPISASNANPIYGLYRSVYTAAKTFSTVLGQNDLSAVAGPWTGAPVLDDFVAGNVVDFSIAFYTSTGTSPANIVGGSYKPVRISGNGAMINNAAYTAGSLAWAEVSITVLEEAGAKVYNAGSGPLTLEQVKLKFGHRLTRKMALRAPY